MQGESGALLQETRSKFGFTDGSCLTPLLHSVTTPGSFFARFTLRKTDVTILLFLVFTTSYCCIDDKQFYSSVGFGGYQRCCQFLLLVWYRCWWCVGSRRYDWDRDVQGKCIRYFTKLRRLHLFPMAWREPALSGVVRACGSDGCVWRCLLRSACTTEPVFKWEVIEFPLSAGPKRRNWKTGAFPCAITLADRSDAMAHRRILLLTCCPPSPTGPSRIQWRTEGFF